MDRLILTEYKALYRALQPRLMKPWDFLVYGFLVWLQNKVIQIKTTSAVDQAIRDFEKAEPHLPSPVSGVYSESGSGFFDEMRMQALFTTTDHDKST